MDHDQMILSSRVVALAVVVVIAMLGAPLH